MVRTSHRLVRLIGSLFSFVMIAAPSPLGPADAKLQAVVDQALQTALASFKSQSLRADQIAITLVDLTEPSQPRHAHHRGEVPLYPASVVKLFYLVAAHQWLEDGRLESTPELDRALRDMIVDSSNDATHYVLDLLTGTTSGPELPPAALAEWVERRNAVNRYFQQKGYVQVNANKKPWSDGPYGRESQASREYQPNRNLLTTDATARLLWEIATQQAVSARRSSEMLALMERDLSGPKDVDPDHQSRFLGPGLPDGSRLWSKAGWTSEARHDATLVQLPDGRRLILVIFTEGHARERGILHCLGRRLVATPGPAAPAPSNSSAEPPRD